MNARLVKEFRVLSIPLLAAVVGGAMQSQLTSASEGGLIGRLGLLIFSGALLIICTQGIGVELQQRTLSFILTQPLPRKRIWDEKFLIAFLVAGLLVLAESIFLSLYVPRYSPQFAVLQWGLWVVASLCSGGFWTLIAGSVIGGMVFTIAGESLFVGIVAVVLGKLYGPDFEVNDHISLIIISSIVYSLIFLLLGRHRFARLELKNISFGEGTEANSAALSRIPMMRWLKPSPRQKNRNLIRKEIFLQAPVLKIGLIFCACCVLAVALLILMPSRKASIAGIFSALACIYGLLIIILSATISLGEERASGIHATQLSLPVSVGAQWLIKATTSWITAMFFGIVLPFFLAAIVSNCAFSKLGIQDFDFEAILGFGLLASGAFVLGFWAVAFLENTVRATFSVFFILSALGCCATLGMLIAEYTRLKWPFLETFIIRHQLPPDFYEKQLLHWVEAILVSALGLGVALRQSYRQFSKLRGGVWVMVRHLIPLSLLVSFLTMSFDSFERTASDFYSRATEELKKDFMAIRIGPVPKARDGQFLKVSLQELEQRVRLPPELKTWLKTSSFFVFNAQNNNRRSDAPLMFVRIDFPNSDNPPSFFYSLPRTNSVSR